MPVRLVGHRDVLPLGAAGSLNGFVKAARGSSPALGQEVALGRLVRPPCSGICDYLVSLPPRHLAHSSAVNTLVLLVFTALCLDRIRYL